MNDAWITFSYVVTLIATILIGYVKYRERRKKSIDPLRTRDLSEITDNSNFEMTEAEEQFQITCV